MSGIYHIPANKGKLVLFTLGICLVLFIGLSCVFTFSRSKHMVRSYKVWAEPCPGYAKGERLSSLAWMGGNSSAPGIAEAVAGRIGSPPSQASVTMLTNMLKERLNLVQDVVFPDYTRPCNLGSSQLEACTSTDCPDQINPVLEERVKDMMAAPELQLTSNHRAAIAAFSQLFPQSEVIILSATSSDHFGETQKMFKSLHEVIYPKLTNFTAVLVDIGLTIDERKEAERGCRCKVVPFPYHLFPEHVKINNCYSFKPLSMLAAMQKANKMVIWQDSSVRWTDGFFHIFQRAERIGTQIIRYEGASRTTAHTLRPTFDYLKREVCAFTTFPEIEACAQMHRNDPVTLRLILEPWARCGLERCCICPVAPWPAMPCVKPIAQHRCHRFDQSALTIMLGRLLDTEFQRFVMPNEFEDKPILYKLGGDELKNYF